MRFAWGAAVLGLLVTGFAAEAYAAPKISTKVRTFAVSGNTGEGLFRSTIRRGPKHGFLSRAIAQTQYTTSWDIQSRVSGGVCKVIYARPNMDLTYSYPEPSEQLNPQVRQRWNRFMTGIRKHEQQHGKYAREMLVAAERSVRGMQTPNDPTCTKTKARLKRQVREVFDKYEAMQVAFDKREHKEYGNVHRLIRNLVKD